MGIKNPILFQTLVWKMAAIRNVNVAFIAVHLDHKRARTHASLASRSFVDPIEDEHASLNFNVTTRPTNFSLPGKIALKCLWPCVGVWRGERLWIHRDFGELGFEQGSRLDASLFCSV
jgi:hypothetical protein